MYDTAKYKDGQCANNELQMKIIRSKAICGRCHRCDKLGHKKYECKINPATDANKLHLQAMMVVNKVGCWTVEPRQDFFEYHALEDPIEVRIAD